MAPTRRRPAYYPIILLAGLIAPLAAPAAREVRAQEPPAAGPADSADVVVVGGTPGGIMAAVAAARAGKSVVLLERTRHVGGLPANGLGATDIATRGATGGLFLEFVARIRTRYAATYGAESEQVRDASDGYHFEPSVAEAVFERMLAEQPAIRVLKMRQFDAEAENVTVNAGRLTGIVVRDREIGRSEAFYGSVFIDATYEGDLAAAAGVRYRTGREGAREYDEPMAGRLYKQWNGPVGPGSSGLGDNAVQAYNFRLALTDRPENRVRVEKPASYDRSEYADLIDDLRLNRVAAPAQAERGEWDWNGIGRIVNMVRLPNGKTDANNQHAAFISTDLPEENWPWPTSGWEWRDRLAQRLRDYTLGLIWFAQNDPELPEDFRRRASEWGLSADEYTDNGNFPRQVYVREGRRIEGEHVFTAHDAIPVPGRERPPIHASSITASHYALDSHAVRKREPGRVHLDGFFSLRNQPYTIPYGVMVPRGVDGLLVPVAVSGTHVGFSTMRMEPAWMALGQAAGEAAALSIDSGAAPRAVGLRSLQDRLIANGAVLIFYRDAAPGDAHYRALQHFGLRGLLPGWEARLGERAADAEAEQWISAAGGAAPAGYVAGRTTRGELLDLLLPSLLRQSR
jgi:hypothetical protein